MPVKEIHLLGDPILYEHCALVHENELVQVRAIALDLHDTMKAFRQMYGYGRAIAAPQIGVLKQVIYINTGELRQVIVNPVISEPSEKMIELWDDCMSFPDLLVRVERHASCVVDYRNEFWEERSIRLKGDLSELIQHEIDHLHGILATMRAIDGTSFALKSQKGHLAGLAFAN
jgi:peptide deformylase